MKANVSTDFQDLFKQIRTLIHLRIFSRLQLSTGIFDFTFVVWDEGEDVKADVSKETIHVEQGYFMFLAYTKFLR